MTSLMLTAILAFASPESDAAAALALAGAGGPKADPEVTLVGRLSGLDPPTVDNTLFYTDPDPPGRTWPEIYHLVMTEAQWHSVAELVNTDHRVKVTGTVDTSRHRYVYDLIVSDIAEVAPAKSTGRVRSVYYWSDGSRTYGPWHYEGEEVMRHADVHDDLPGVRGDLPQQPVSRMYVPFQVVTGPAGGAVHFIPPRLETMPAGPAFCLPVRGG